MKRIATSISKIFASMAIFAGALMFFPAQADAQGFAEDFVKRDPVVNVPGDFAGIGPVVSGSIDFSKIPDKARKFLQKNCDGHAIVRCDKTYSTGDVNIALADGIEMRFDRKGNLVDIEAPANYSLAPGLLKAVVPGKLYHLLDHNGFLSSVEAVSRENKDYNLEVSDPVFSRVCYDGSGVLTMIVDR